MSDMEEKVLNEEEGKTGVNSWKGMEAKERRRREGDLVDLQNGMEEEE